MIWRACHPSCSSTGAGSTSVSFTGEQDPPQARLELRDPVTGVDLARLRFTAELTEDSRARTATFEADLPGHGVRLVKRFAVSRDGYEVVLTVRLVGANAAAFMAGRRLDLELGAGRGLFPPAAPGFAAMLDRVHRVLVGPDGVRALGDESGKVTPFRLGEWGGIRSRFWAILVQADGAGSLQPRPGEGLTLAPASEPGRLTWRYTFYSGPVEPRALAAADPELGRLFLSGLWFWLRALSVGLLYLLRGLTTIVGNHGVAIIALAVCVKLLLFPLTKIAERLQEQVNATQARLQPGLDAINAAHRGEERARRTLALYREAGVHPFYTLRSLAGFLIQLPVFIAVFDMLAEDFDLHGVRFLWIRDLARPDELWRLPACLPFFGCHLNLLPVLMSSISIGAVLQARSAHLTPPLVRRQRRNLTAMALGFFLLFYTFPASMVLYWTSTNSVQLVTQEWGRLRRRFRPTGTNPPG
ncbi:MAG TPA: membrane protein insertase YidC [Methylomirabilota bacterium]|nr:membrane protein insertase YidC [Methylomirabilota bacterium]